MMPLGLRARTFAYECGHIANLCILYQGKAQVGRRRVDGYYAYTTCSKG